MCTGQSCAARVRACPLSARVCCCVPSFSFEPIYSFAQIFSNTDQTFAWKPFLRYVICIGKGCPLQNFDSFCVAQFLLPPLCAPLFTVLYNRGAGTAAVGGRLEAAKNRHGSNPNPMPFSFLPSGTEEIVMLNMSQASN